MSDRFTEGREPVTIIEVDQDQCTLTYSEAPCTAAIGVTGPDRCFNTLSSCQDEDNYDRGTLTLRFVKPMVEIPQDWNAIPCLDSVTTVPTKINPGGGDSNSEALGQRASVTATFSDIPSSDFQVDKYVDQRDYNPLERGTFWTKWLRRNPYYQGRAMRVREGYLGQELSEMRVRHYIIEEVNGPNGQGKVQIKAKDILKLADDERAQAPRASNGELTADISDTVTSFTALLARSEEEYPTGGGTIRIGDEVMDYGSASYSGGEVTFSSVTRGARNTEAEEHDEGDTVQLCLEFVGEDCWVVVRDLLQNYGNVPSGFIPFSDWNAEGSRWLPQFTVTALLTEPEGVTKLVGEICQQCLFYVWWDERDQEIKLKALRPPDEDPKRLTDNANILEDSLTTWVEPDQRVSQVWIYYLPRNPTESLDETSNYRRLRVRIDPEAETADQYGEKRVKQIFSRWLESDAQVVNLSTRYLGRYRDNPSYVKLSLDAKDRDLWTGDVADIEARNFVDDFGLTRTARYQVISVEERQPGHRVEYEMLSFQFVGGRFAFWMEEFAPQFADATDDEKENGAWWAQSDGTMPDGSDGYTWI